MKYSNQVVMYMISSGYIILIISGFIGQTNIIYLLAPYALLTCVIIHYTQKRSTNFLRYWMTFELGINEKGHLLKFYILALNTGNETLPTDNNFEIVKVGQYQTQYIVNPLKLQAMIANLGYSICYLPDLESQIVISNSTSNNESVGIPASHYEQIANEYKTFKSVVINRFKQNVSNLLEPNINQPIFNREPKKHKSITSFLRQQ